MCTTLNINDQLCEEATRLTGVKEKTALIELESARRLALLSGTEPELDEIPRRRNSK